MQLSRYGNQSIHVGVTGREPRMLLLSMQQLAKVIVQPTKSFVLCLRALREITVGKQAWLAGYELSKKVHFPSRTISSHRRYTPYYENLKRINVNTVSVTTHLDNTRLIILC